MDIKIRLNPEDPNDAAIIDVLLSCLSGRRAAKARELMAAGLGVAAHPAPAPVRRRPSVPEKSPAPAPSDNGEESDALARATNNFLDAFGGGIGK